ncbi:collagen alpha-1(X) chain-like [Scomber scombrus]|uniref:Collagen alpha-1(X) chain-like n=1 Tax=Scomber scombrus TaxID=13677 RepID=A0AAV1PVN1_SCOSC
MATISVIILVCLLAGLSNGQAESNKSETLTELTQKGLADNNDNQNSNQRQDTSAILTSNTTTTQESFEPPIYMLWKELGALGERMDATVRALDETKRKLEASEKQLAAFTGTVTKLGTMVRGQPRVAFSATLPVNGTIGPMTSVYPLVYHNVVLNIGNAYSPVTGYFTAPVPGAYYFSFTSYWWGGNGSTGGSLFRNGYQVVSWYRDQPHNTSGSNSAILLLQVGDKVNVRLWEGQKISDNGNNYSSFSGFLIFPVWSV